MAVKPTMLALGLMTGTALDGFIDAALVETDGHSISALGPHALLAYDPQVRALMAEAVSAARVWAFEGPEPAIFAEAERRFTLAHADAVSRFLKDCGATPDLIGLHGLTVLHRPAVKGRVGATRQLGDGALLAQTLQRPVIYDFRSADVEAGGQGAPLAPVYHAALLRRSGFGQETAVLNLGGVANLTWRADSGALAAFDCGPANGPINEWVEAHGVGLMDAGGRLGALGRVHDALLEQVLDHPFFDWPYPKSLDRYDFSASLVRGLSLADGAATLTALAAEGVARGAAILPHRPTRLVVCGGGRKNPTMMSMISARAGAQVVDADALGWRGDAIEAEAFAFLAVRSLQGLALSFPGTTGVGAPLTGGRLALP